jgi:GMP synthase (glutamine-hydrolysing)
MRKLLVFQHVPFEPLGTLNAQFKEAGFRIRYANFDRKPGTEVTVSRYHGLVVLGGPMSADQADRHSHLEYEKDVIRTAVDRGLPVLGICLGAQLIAASFGGKTLRGKAPEFGWVDVEATPAGREDPLFAHFDGREKIFQWHADTFTLPHGFVQLADSANCAHQAFRLHEQVYGLQFHLEADRALIARWLSSAQHLKGRNGRELELNPSRVLAETDRFVPRAAKLARALFGEFIERFYSFRRRRMHGTR